MITGERFVVKDYFVNLFLLLSLPSCLHFCLNLVVCLVLYILLNYLHRLVFDSFLYLSVFLWLHICCTFLDIVSFRSYPPSPCLLVLLLNLGATNCTLFIYFFLCLHFLPDSWPHLWPLLLPFSVLIFTLPPRSIAVFLSSCSVHSFNQLEYSLTAHFLYLIPVCVQPPSLHFLSSWMPSCNLSVQCPWGSSPHPCSRCSMPPAGRAWAPWASPSNYWPTILKWRSQRWTSITMRWTLSLTSAHGESTGKRTCDNFG